MWWTVKPASRDNKSAVVRFENAYKMYILLSLLIK